MQHINDSNISEIEVTLKKTNTKKIYVSAQRMIYSKPIKEIHQQFCKQSGITISLSLFYKLKPFYIGPPTEREKLTCLCKDCQNIHLLLQGINTYQKTKTMMTHMSVTNYLQEINDDALKTEEYPEVSDTKTINYYLFELKEESFRNGKEINYKRTTRVERRDRVCDIVKRLKDSGPSYLKHRSYVDNIESGLPAIRAVFTGKYIELDFSENLSMKPKVEIQSAHFSGKQFCLHCANIEPGETKYEYHFSDDTTHDFAFVKKVLEDIFVSREIKNQLEVIKSDNAGSQYKNKYAFESLIELSKKFNVTIVRIFGAAGHGKGLIDSMSSFGY